MATKYEYHWSPIGLLNVYYSYAQTFTPSVSHSIKMVRVYKIGVIGPYQAVHIKLADANDLPTGNPLCSAPACTTMPPGVYPAQYIDFGNGTSLSAGIKYAIEVAQSGLTSVMVSQPTYSGGKFSVNGVVNENYDMWFEEWDGNFPYPPTLVSPEGTEISVTPTLTATYSHSGSVAQKATQWQITLAADTNFDTPIWSVEMGTDLLSTVVPGGILSYNTEYRWRCKHKDNNDEWSGYPALDFNFTTGQDASLYSYWFETLEGSYEPGLNQVIIIGA